MSDSNDVTQKTTTQPATFTPLFDELVDQGFSLAERAIYGQIWRYSQMSEGRCTATLETIAENIGVSKKTVIRALASLKEHGLVVDLTPEIKNHYHRRIVVQPVPGNTRSAEFFYPDQPASAEPIEPQNASLNSTGGVLTGTICLTSRTDCPPPETICPEIETDCLAVKTICPAQRVNLTPEDTIKETIKDSNLKKESHHHADEPFFSENQWLAAEINAWFEKGDPGSERAILNLLKKHDHNLMNYGREVNGREIVVEILEWALPRPGMTLRKALSYVQKSVASWNLEHRYKFVNGVIYQNDPEADEQVGAHLCVGPARPESTPTDGDTSRKFPETPFDAMQALVEKVTGYPQTAKDCEALNYFVESGVTLEDLRAALAFFQERGRQVYGAAQLLNSVKFQVARRTQKEYAQEAQPRPMRTLRDVNGKEIQVPA
jgi:DNA-binding MarR family transcriptional regulator